MVIETGKDEKFHYIGIFASPVLFWLSRTLFLGLLFSPINYRIVS